MRLRPRRSPWSLPSARDAAAASILTIAACSLAGAAWVQAGGGVPEFRRAPQRPAAAAADPCDPVIGSLSATGAPAEGGVPLTINGANFAAGGVRPTVRFGHAVAAPDPWSDTQLVVTVPPQRDDPTPSVSVVLPDGRVSPPVPFTYADPVVVPEPDAAASFGRGTVLTIRGDNFRCSNPRAWLDDGSGVTADCEVIAADDDSLVVVLPDWDAPTATLRTGIVHRDLAARNILFDGPQLVSVSPPTWPAHGGALITLTGSNFVNGGESSRVKVLRAGRAVEAPVVSQTDTEIVAIAPGLLEDVTGTTNVGVLVERAGKKSKTYQNKSDQDIAQARFASPAGGAAAGGTIITIRGDNFRPGAGISGLGAPVPATVLDATTLTFELPPLAPGLHAVSVEQNGKLSPPVEIEVAAPPEIVSMSPASVPADGRTVLTITGHNFGISDLGMSRAASVGQGGNASGVGPVRWMAPEVLQIVCPPGTPGPADLTLEIAGVPVTLPDAFTYTAPTGEPLPELSSLSPPGLTRLGGNLITLTGQNFGPPGSASVIFGSTSVTPLSQSETEIVFVQPPMSESRQGNPVYVEKGNTGTSPIHESKRAPGAGATSGPGTYGGGVLITVTGADFAPGARVRFGSAGGATTEGAALQVTPSSLVVVSPEVDGETWSELSVVRDDLASPPVPFALAGPSLSDVSEREIAPGAATITIHGADFAPGCVAYFEDRPVETRYFNPAEITIDKPVPWKKRTSSAAPLEPLRVVNPDGAASDSIRVRWKAPELNSASSHAARAGGGVYLTVTGQNFGPAATITIVGSGFFDSPPIVDRSATDLVALLGPSDPGTFELGVVDDALGSSPPAPLERLAPPVVLSVTPSSVPLAGNVPITIVGQNFGPPGAALARTVRVAGQACVLDATRSQDDGLVVTVPPGPAGPVDLVVTIDGVADTLESAFSYGGTTGVTPPPAAPRELALRAGPTPFRDGLALSFAVPAAGRWTLELYDSRGARVRRFEGETPGAAHELRWDGRDAAGRDAAPGVYFARLTTPAGQRSIRAVKLR